MRPISRSVTRKDHEEKVSGRTCYTADLQIEGALHTRFVRSEKANARIVSVAYPPLPEGYFAVDGRDLPVNEAELHAKDMPVFVSSRVSCVGDPIALIAGPDEAMAERLARETVVSYDSEKPAVTTLHEANEYFYDFPLTKGDIDAAYAGADFIHEETFETGRQEQAYLEPQSMIAWTEGGVLTVKGSMQCPYYIVGALKHAFCLPEDQIRVIQAATGGGFGGKEEYPSLLACQLGAAAIKSGKPCRLVYGRGEDIANTTKRHPAAIRYRAAIKDGRVTAMDVDIVLDGGAYRGLSSVVLQRAMFCCTGVYDIQNLRVRGRVARTNTPSNGAFRGFGAPQSFFAVESLMNHIAARLSEDELSFKRRHFVKQHDRTATSGIYHEPVPLVAMLDRALSMSGYTQKQAAFAAQTGRYRKGIGAAIVFHGCGFTGNGERDIIRAVVRLEKAPDGTVLLLGSSTEMGQGLRTTFPKIVAKAMDIPLSRVRYELPDTQAVPDSGPTVASRSIMVVGRLFERAAKRLKAQWIDGEAQTVEEHYTDPPHRLPFDMNTFTGDAYPAYSWAVNVVEVEVDTCTAQPRATGVWAVFDCGTPVDYNVLRGQVEGGIAQGLGYGAMERMDVSENGSVRQASLTDYIIPTAVDIPPIEVAFHDDPYAEGPYGARGAGELTLVAAAPAYTAAVENALSIQARKIPLLPEDILRSCSHKREMPDWREIFSSNKEQEGSVAGSYA